jgi:hypothetical protein
MHGSKIHKKVKHSSHWNQSLSQWNDRKLLFTTQLDRILLKDTELSISNDIHLFKFAN